MNYAQALALTVGTDTGWGLSASQYRAAIAIWREASGTDPAAAAMVAHGGLESLQMRLENAEARERGEPGARQ